MDLNTLLSISAIIYIGYSLFNLCYFIYKMSHCISAPFVFLYKKLFNRIVVLQQPSNTFEQERISLTPRNRERNKERNNDKNLPPFSQV